MMRKKRLNPAQRRADILTVALGLSERTHYLLCRRAHIAAKLGVSPPAITYHFGTMPQLQRAIMRAAISRGNLAVLAQGLVMSDAHAMKAPRALRLRALATIGVP